MTVTAAMHRQRDGAILNQAEIGALAQSVGRIEDSGNMLQGSMDANTEHPAWNHDPQQPR
jgi:HAMP domain-containing protein